MSALLRMAVVAVSILLALLLAEGARTLALGSRRHTSIVQWAATQFADQRRSDGPTERAADAPASTGNNLPSRPLLIDRAEFERLLPLFKSIDAGVGNTDFDELITDNASVNVEDGTCTRMKPNLRKLSTQIRTRLFNVYDPPAVFYDASASLPVPVQEFFSRYAVRTTRFTTNGHGERVTLPAVESRQKVLIAGDSVALGLGVDDPETLSSRLQSRDMERQYINLGVSGIGPPQIACALEEAGTRYAGNIVELIYVQCDNDFDATDEATEPEAVVAWVKGFAQRHGIARVTFVRSPYLQVLFPIGTETDADRVQMAWGRRLAEVARDAGFTYIDLGDLVLDEIGREQSAFGIFRMFVDKVHFSPYGLEKVANRLR